MSHNQQPFHYEYAESSQSSSQSSRGSSRSRTAGDSLYRTPLRRQNADSNTQSLPLPYSSSQSQFLSLSQAASQSQPTFESHIQFRSQSQSQSEHSSQSHIQSQSQSASQSRIQTQSQPSSQSRIQSQIPSIFAESSSSQPSLPSISEILPNTDEIFDECLAVPERVLGGIEIPSGYTRVTDKSWLGTQGIFYGLVSGRSRAFQQRSESTHPVYMFWCCGRTPCRKRIIVQRHFDDRRSTSNISHHLVDCHGVQSERGKKVQSTRAAQNKRVQKLISAKKKMCRDKSQSKRFYSLLVVTIGLLELKLAKNMVAGRSFSILCSVLDSSYKGPSVSFLSHTLLEVYFAYREMVRARVLERRGFFEMPFISLYADVWEGRSETSKLLGLRMTFCDDTCDPQSYVLAVRGIVSTGGSVYQKSQLLASWIIQICHQFHICIGRDVSSLICDGASDMAKCSDLLRFGTYLSRENPGLASWCIAHRINRMMISIADHADAKKVMSKMIKLIRRVRKSKGRTILKARLAAKRYYATGLKTFSKVRWASRVGCMERFLALWPDVKILCTDLNIKNDISEHDITYLREMYSILLPIHKALMQAQSSGIEMTIVALVMLLERYDILRNRRRYEERTSLKLVTPLPRIKPPQSLASAPVTTDQPPEEFVESDLLLRDISPMAEDMMTNTIFAIEDKFRSRLLLNKDMLLVSFLYMHPRFRSLLLLKVFLTRPQIERLKNKCEDMILEYAVRGAPDDADWLQLDERGVPPWSRRQNATSQESFDTLASDVEMSDSGRAAAPSRGMSSERHGPERQDEWDEITQNQVSAGNRGDGSVNPVVSAASAELSSDPFAANERYRHIVADPKAASAVRSSSQQSGSRIQSHQLKIKTELKKWRLMDEANLPIAGFSSFWKGEGRKKFPSLAKHAAAMTHGATTAELERHFSKCSSLLGTRRTSMSDQTLGLIATLFTAEDQLPPFTEIPEFEKGLEPPARLDSFGSGGERSSSATDDDSDSECDSDSD